MTRSEIKSKIAALEEQEHTPELEAEHKELCLKLREMDRPRREREREEMKRETAAMQKRAAREAAVVAKALNILGR